MRPGLFWKGLGHISRNGWSGGGGERGGGKKKAALPLVAAVAAETPQRK